MRAVNNELLSQFAYKELTINEGIADDARLIKSASHLRSKEQLKEEKKISETPEGKLDKSDPATLLNALVIWSRTGRLKMIFRTMVSKSMLPLMFGMGLSLPRR
jgi:hypothetical protein